MKKNMKTVNTYFLCITKIHTYVNKSYIKVYKTYFLKTIKYSE